LVRVGARPAPRPPLFPYTTLFRSGSRAEDRAQRWAEPPGERRTRRPAVSSAPGCPGRGGVLGDAAIGAVPARSARAVPRPIRERSEEHTSELQSRENLVCRLLLEK